MTLSSTRRVERSLAFLVGGMIVAFLAPVPGQADSPLRDEAVSYRLQGYQAQSKGSWEEAIAHYQKAIALDPTYPTPHNDLGVIYEQQGRLDEAEREYRRALELDPNYLSGHSNLALLYEKRGEFDAAARHWERRASLGSPDDAWTQRARERLALLKPQLSQPFLAESVTVAPHSTQAVTVAAPSHTPSAAALPIATPITMQGASAPPPPTAVSLPTGMAQYPPYPTSAAAQSGYGSTPRVPPSVASQYPQQPLTAAQPSRLAGARELSRPMPDEAAEAGGWKRWVPFRRYIPFLGDRPKTADAEEASTEAGAWQPPTSAPAPPRAAEEAYQRGVEWYRQERYAEAWDAFRQAQDLDPGNPKIARYLERSEAALQEQQRQQVARRTEALKQQDLAERERVARRIEDHYIRGRLYYEQGAYTKAKAEFEQILAALLESQLIR